MINKAVCLSLVAVSVTLAACEPKRIVTALPIPAERMDCVYVAQRPTIPPEVTTSLEAFKQSVRAREGIVAGYILGLESRYWACADDATWLRQWQAETVR